MLNTPQDECERRQQARDNGGDVSKIVNKWEKMHDNWVCLLPGYAECSASQLEFELRWRAKA